MQSGGRTMVTYNLRKALLYLQRAKVCADQAGDLEEVRDISRTILQISSLIKKKNEK